MTESIRVPDKYRIIWLDRHIGDPEYNQLLKRVFFSHVDPQTYQVTPFSEKDRDIDTSIASGKEISGAFDNDHFTLQTFTDPWSCVDYIEQVQNDRILLIASNRLGEMEAHYIMSRYHNAFGNKTDEEIYRSIYILRVRMRYADKWAMDYMGPINLFDHEQDLFERMMHNLGNEFVEQGNLLRAASQLEDALGRFSWARSMYIRRELPYPYLWEPSAAEANIGTGAHLTQDPQSASIRSPKSSRIVGKVDALIKEVEAQIKKKQGIYESDQVHRVMLARQTTLHGSFVF